MLPVITFVVVDDDEEGAVSLLAEKLVYVLAQNKNQTYCQQQLSSINIAETKEVVPVDKELFNAVNNLDTSCNEEAQKIVAKAERKAYNSMAGKETMQPKLLDF